MAKVSGPQQQGIWLRGEGHGKARRCFYGSRKDWMSGRAEMRSEQEVTTCEILAWCTETVHGLWLYFLYSAHVVGTF